MMKSVEDNTISADITPVCKSLDNNFYFSEFIFSYVVYRYLVYFSKYLRFILVNI